MHLLTHKCADTFGIVVLCSVRVPTQKCELAIERPACHVPELQHMLFTDREPARQGLRCWCGAHEQVKLASAWGAPLTRVLAESQPYCVCARVRVCVCVIA